MSYKEIVKNNNLEVSVIGLDRLEGALRLDSDFYQTHFLRNEELLNSKKTEPVIKLTKFVKKGIFDISPTKYQDKGTPLIRVKDIKNGFLNYSDMTFLSEADHKKEKKTELDYGDIVFSKVGTVGEIALIEEKSNFSQNVLGIKIEKEKINPFYLLAFLMSPAGYLQIKRAEMISVQPKLELKDIRDLRVVIPSNSFQNLVADFILKSKTYFDEAKLKFKEAEQILLKELKLADYKSDDNNISVREFKDCLAANRFDAEYWQIKYDQLLVKVRKYKTEKLGDIVSYKKGIEVGSEEYIEQGLPFVRVSDFTTNGVEAIEKKISKELFEELKLNYSPKKGEVLFTKDGTIGITYALEENLDVVLSGAFLRLKPKVKIDNEYLTLVLNSIICKMQIERMSGGAVISHLKPVDAMNLVIPVLDKHKQSLISEKIKQSKILNQQSQQLLKKAKRAVEIFIEQDEKQALDYLNK